MTKPIVSSEYHRSTPVLWSLQDELTAMPEPSGKSTSARQTERGFFGDLNAMPVLDLAETENALVLFVEVPGVSETDLDVTVQGELLIIKGEKSLDPKVAQSDFRIFERQYGSFQREVPLGFVPEAGALSASFDNGLLQLSIAKPADARSEVPV